MSEHEPGFDAEIGGYRRVRELGRGAMGVVFEARDPADGVVALKVLVPPPLMSADDRDGLRKRFLREARAMSAVDHPNVVRVYDAGEANGLLFLSMELLDGENLRTLLARTGPLAPAEAVGLVLQLCEALEAVHHAGIIHRDVKPENVIVLRDGTLKLTDFGVAWMENEATLTRTGGVLGSPAYMSPEQILGRPVDRRSDLFSAAVTLYQLLANRLPFAGAGLMEMAHNVAYAEPEPLPAHVPYALARVVLRGLQKSPAARYATTTEFAGALRATLARQAPAARVLPPAPAPAGPVAGTCPTAPALAATVVQADLRCARHPRQPAIGLCQVCSRPLCPACARRDRPPFYCFIHAPVTFFGISIVRLEVTLAVLVFLLLLLSLSPVGYWLLRR
jgi:serine/threonine protein kinase